MLSGASLKRYPHAFTGVWHSIIIDDTSEGNIEVARVGVEIMVPYFYSEHEGLPRHGRDVVGGWVVGVDRRGA